MRTERTAAPDGVIRERHIHEECGVFGVFARETTDVASLAYYALYALQHRGQESAGIAVNDDGVFTAYRDVGLVSEVFPKERLQALGTGSIAVGHVRYGTTGSDNKRNVQPILVNHFKGRMALAHNGNLTNSQELRQKLESSGSIFHTTTDSEVIAYIIVQERLKTSSIEAAVSAAMGHIEGAYSLVISSPTKLIAVRDPHGFRPLCMGHLKDGSVVFASESCALDAIGAEGRFLAQEHPVEADVVIGVPDSGLDAALGYSQESGIPYGIGFIKNKYIGRTFIQGSQKQRENSVRIKLNVVSSTVKGKRVVLVDDSIVRGTTSARIIKLLRDAGAKEVHFRVSAPPFKYPCYFGTDIPDQKLLVATGRNVEQINEIIGADTLGYLSAEHVVQLAKNAKCGFCTACFTGEYAVRPEEVLSTDIHERHLNDRPKNEKKLGE